MQSSIAPRRPIPPVHPVHRLVPVRAKIRVVEVPVRYNVGADLLERNLPKHASKIAIHSAVGETTYGDLLKLSNGAARRLLDLGVRREERVLIAGYDSPGLAPA